MRKGIHAPNAPWTQESISRYRIAGFPSVKLMYTDGTKHTLEDVRELKRRGCGHFMVRLPDSVAPGGRWKGDEEWAGQCIEAIRLFSQEGITDYQLGNEDNLIWPLDKAWLCCWLSARVVYLIKRTPGLPPNLRLGMAPLAWKPDTWDDVQNVWIPEQRKWLHSYDYICVHSYWENPDHWNLPPAGGNITHWHDAFFAGVDLPYMITEWGLDSKRPSAEIEAIRIRQYPEWLQWLQERTTDAQTGRSYVEGAYLYILDGTKDWQRFWPTDRVLRAVA